MVVVMFELYFRPMWHFSLIPLCLALSLATSAKAEVLEGMVTGIADGDTLYVLDAGRVSHKIRLLGIDAPEQGQAFGERSKQSLARMTYRQAASVDWQARDAYGRILGRVRVATADCQTAICPKNFDANLAQVRLGFAWWNKKFADSQFPGDARAYEAAERQARTERAGLWADANPLPPWAWRRQHPRQ
jgi:endonuclease YncB( thermonuclease family)